MPSAQLLGVAQGSSGDFSDLDRTKFVKTTILTDIDLKLKIKKNAIINQ